CDPRLSRSCRWSSTPSGGRPPAFALLLEVLERRDPPRRAHDPAAGVRRRPAHPEVLHRRPVARPARHRPVEGSLPERELALEEVALREAGDLLDVLRRHELLSDDVPPD